MSVSLRSLGIDRLSVEERLALVEDLWDSIAGESAATSLTDAQRAEIDRRLADHEANPNDAFHVENTRLRLVSPGERRPPRATSHPERPFKLGSLA